MNENTNVIDVPENEVAEIVETGTNKLTSEEIVCLGGVIIGAAVIGYGIGHFVITPLVKSAVKKVKLTLAKRSGAVAAEDFGDDEVIFEEVDTE